MLLKKRLQETSSCIWVCFIFEFAFSNLKADQMAWVQQKQKSASKDMPSLVP